MKFINNVKINENKIRKKTKAIIKFIYVFFIIGVESLGNMSAVMAILEENLIKKNKYVTEEDIIDAVTISRLGPGATTANAVSYLGNKIAGFLGGVVAGICYTIGPLIIMLIIYGFIEKLLEISRVQSALKGCLIYICILFIRSSVDMGKSVLNNKFNIIIFISGVTISLLLKVSCVYIIIGSIFFGIIKIFIENRLGKENRNKNKKQLFLPYR